MTVGSQVHLPAEFRARLGIPLLAAIRRLEALAQELPERRAWLERFLIDSRAQVGLAELQNGEHSLSVEMWTRVLGHAERCAGLAKHLPDIIAAQRVHEDRLRAYAQAWRVVDGLSRQLAESSHRGCLSLPLDVDGAGAFARETAAEAEQAFLAPPAIADEVLIAMTPGRLRCDDAGALSAFTRGFCSLWGADTLLREVPLSDSVIADLGAAALGLPGTSNGNSPRELRDRRRGTVRSARVRVST